MLLAKDTEINYASELLLAFVVNEEINQTILQHINAEAWNAKPLGPGSRTIAAIFAHVHNTRRKWIRLSAPHLKMPSMLDRSCTQEQARKAFGESAACCKRFISGALCPLLGRASQFLRVGWAHPWPAGPMMVAYMISHEAHHRGQVCMLAHQLGYPLSGSVISSMWNWERMQKQLTTTTAPQLRKARRKASS
jgi:uncharacterized damage-inducible protein DinB